MKKLTGQLQQLLFSPKGGIEGLLLAVGEETIQLSMDPGVVDCKALENALGKMIEATGTVDSSEKTRHAVHPVYHLEALLKVDGKKYDGEERSTHVSGIVGSLHFAKHGEPNGVVLKGGEFIHLRPPGMKKLKLKVGSKVNATGEVRMTVLGTLLLEAHEVNEVSLE